MENRNSRTCSWYARAASVLSRISLFVIGVLSALPALADTLNLPAIVSTPTPGGGQTYTLSIQLLLLLSALSFLPGLLLLMTGFTRIIIVLSLLRQAIGLQNSPPNQVMVGLALFLTMFIMAPVFDKIYDEAYLPLSQQKITQDEALKRAEAPIKAFMLKQTREPDLALFMKLGNQPPLQSADQVPIKILVPAFVTSELKTAFQIGFIIFIPFIIIDMVVSSVLMSMGMMMLSPVLISLPFKLMLFVLVDGWTLLISSLVQSFSL
ncbi:MAG: flagellar type III secretion system pore protein FliP [Pseudomonadota bacterium]